ncbi:MAG TPA: UDP-N-acetylmuramoyl-L-alanyl-D-glutamate--2,6-diaminopimelate ligase [Limnobacter sp.]|nr:UDP-N-acetylmuramoyl-L-alanyl-D-glutamate--2,6-diaminopimelate ligase [Limnobacter sp.]
MISAYLHSVAEVIAELHERGFYADCSSLVTDHRRLSGPKDVFLAVPGMRYDPRTMADDLIREQRCGLVLVEYDDARVYQSASVLSVLNLKACLAQLAKTYYESPSEALDVIAVTGTNGKTTVTRWLAQSLSALGKRAAVLGTLGYGSPADLKEHSGLTTPDVVGMHHTLHELKRQGFDTVCLEASSIGLDQGRLRGVDIDWAVFTNFSQDHLDYHGTMDAYGQAKLILANWPTLRAAVANVDDALGKTFADVVTNRHLPCTRVGSTQGLELHVLGCVHAGKGMRVEFKPLQGPAFGVAAPVIGQFNAENLAVVAGVLLSMGHGSNEVQRALQQVSAAPGRMEMISESPCVVVDYAHTPDALEKVLIALRPFARARDGRLIALFGCGGDRDRSKRPRMGELAAQLADAVVLTSDNPRGESPEAILAEIVSGVAPSLSHKVQLEIDRKAAIAQVLAQANAQDVIVLAGKGHETTQTIGQHVLPHSDVLVARAILQKGGAHA